MRTLLILTTLSGVLRAGEPGLSFHHTSWPEASAIATAGTPARWFVVADNELKKLALYPLTAEPAPPHRPTLTAAVSPEYEADDLEAVTVFPWDENGDGKPEQVLHVFTASCSRTKSGKVRPERDALFAVTVDTAAAAAGKEPFPAAVEYNRTLRSQLRALGSEHPATPWGPALRDSVHPAGAKPGDPVPALADSGLNIEGLTVSKDGRSLLLGLRHPVVNGRALLVPLTNPVAALGLGGSAPQPAALSAPMLLDLGGHGIRSIEWDAAAGVFLIAAGEGKVTRFFRWSGDPSQRPEAVTSASAQQAGGINPEGITPVPGEKAAAVVGDDKDTPTYHRGLWVDFGPAK